MTDLDFIVPGSQLTPRQAELVENALLAARSERTRATYASAFRGFERWATANNAPVPSDPRTVSAFIATRFESGISAATISVDLAAIRAFHLDHGNRDPTGHRAVTQVMAGLKRMPQHAAPRKARALSMSEFRRLLSAIEPGPSGVRDRALILTMLASAARRAELSELDRTDVRLNEQGALITFRKSKGDQAQAGQSVGYPHGEHPLTDPVLALRRWLAISGPCAVFKRVTRTGSVVAGSRLTPHSINRILQRRALAAGVDMDSLTAHSTRVSHVSVTSMAGVDILSVQRQTRHRDIRTVAGYARSARAIQDSSANGLGL